MIMEDPRVASVMVISDRFAQATEHFDLGYRKVCARGISKKKTSVADVASVSNQIATFWKETG